MKEIRPSLEFWEYLMKTSNDPKFKYEYVPAAEFRDRAEEEFNIQINQFEDGPGENLPPDYIMEIDNLGKVGLEVTCVTDPQLRKHGSYFVEVEKILNKIIQIHISLLKPGSYMFFYYPGDYTRLGKGQILTQNFDFKMNLKVMYGKLDQAISQWFSRYYDVNNRSIQITDDKGNAVRVVMMHKMEYGNHEFSIYPQGINKYIEENAGLRIEMQKAIDRKTEKYKKKPWLLDFEQVWLLLYIVGEEMDINFPGINIESIRIAPKIFDCVFLVHDAITEFHLYELTNEWTTSG